MIQLGLAAGTLWDSPLGKAPNHTKSSLICWPLFIYLMKEILSYCEKEGKKSLEMLTFHVHHFILQGYPTVVSE